MNSSDAPKSPTAMPPMVGRCRPYAAGQQRLHAHHPERRNGGDQARHAAGNEHFRKHQATVPDAQQQQTAQAIPSQFTAARQVKAAGRRESQENAAGKQEPRATSISGGNDSSDMRIPR